MISKTLTGVRFFDDQYGGTYRGRAIMVCGPKASGKSVFGLQFIAQGVRQGERSLLLSGRPAADMMIYAQSLGMPIDSAIDNGSVIVLEYNDYVPGPDAESQLYLPPEGIVQLQEIIAVNAIQRVVLDTCLPWMTIPVPDKLGQHVFSFVRSFDRLGTTTLLTLPKPVSPMAFKLRRVLEDVVPVAITLTQDENTDRLAWIVNKYLGESRLDPGTDYEIDSGNGLHARSGGGNSVETDKDVKGHGEPPREDVASRLTPKQSQEIRFSRVLEDPDVLCTPITGN